MTSALERLLSFLPEAPERARALLEKAEFAREVEAEARAFGLYPLVAHLLPDAFALKREELLSAQFRAARLERTTLEATGELEAAGVEVIAFKGAVLAARLYPHPSLRPSTDVDLLVRPGAADAAKAALLAAGWTLWLDPRSRPLDFQHSINFHRRGVMLELHWVLGSGFQSRFDGERLFARSTTVQPGGRTVRVLGRADELVHLCAHAAAHIFDGVKWLYDLKLAIRAGGFSWDEVVVLAAEAQVRAAAGMALWEAARRVGAEVPPEPLARLAPGRLRRAATWGIEAIPPEYKRTRSTSLGLLLTDGISAEWALRLAGPVIKRAALGVNLAARRFGLPRIVPSRFEPASSARQSGDRGDDGDGHD